MKKYIKSIVLIVLVNCSSLEEKNTLSKKKMIEKQKLLLSSIRPVLKSDELPFMKCKSLGRVQIEKDASKNLTKNLELLKSMGDFELREKVVELGGNIVSLESSQFGDIIRFFADVYQCKEVSDAFFVEIAGMCKPSKQKLFKIKYDPEELRDIGEELLKTKIRYYAISNHYKTFHFRNIKYSYTKKEFEGEGFFYKCY